MVFKPVPERRRSLVAVSPRVGMRSTASSYARAYAASSPSPPALDPVLHWKGWQKSGTVGRETMMIAQMRSSDWATAEGSRIRFFNRKTEIGAHP
jgi:hypothetical protein